MENSDIQVITANENHAREVYMFLILTEAQKYEYTK